MGSQIWSLPILNHRPFSVNPQELDVIALTSQWDNFYIIYIFNLLLLRGGQCIIYGFMMETAVRFFNLCLFKACCIISLRFLFNDVRLVKEEVKAI